MTLTLQSHFNIDTSYKDTKTVHNTNDKQTCSYKAHNHQINNPYNH